MCHLALFMPIFALPVFWLLPWPAATAIYLAVLVLSAWLYYVVFKIMHRPSLVGMQTLIDRRGKLIQASGSCGLARIGRELWKVESRVPLRVDDDVRVTGHRGFVLEVVQPEGGGRKGPASG